MLNIGYGKVCNSKLTLSNFAEISNYTATLNIPLIIQYLRIVVLFTGSLFSRGISEGKHLNSERSDCELYAQIRIQFKSFSIEEKYDSSVQFVEWPDSSQLFNEAEYVMKNPVDRGGFFPHTSVCHPTTQRHFIHNHHKKTSLNLSNTLLSNYKIRQHLTK